MPSSPPLIPFAFTTHLPLAVMIALGIKQWENRAMMPSPSKGRCAMSVSKGSNEAEYTNFLLWAQQAFPQEWLRRVPPWEVVQHWRGKIVAVCDYDASCIPEPKVWDEGYQVWWKLSNVTMLKEPVPCRGNTGM